MSSTLDALVEQNRDGAVLHLPEGMLGFSRLTQYVVVQEESLHPFLWLQSLDDPKLAFPVVDPHLIDKDYSRLLPGKEISSLHIKNRSELLVLVVAILRQSPGESSVNLKAPLLINLQKMIGRQIILTESDSKTRAAVNGYVAESTITAPAFPG